MNLEEAAESIIALMDRDEKLRHDLIKKGLLENSYNKDMESLHLKNAMELEEIINDIGFPTSEKVGLKASNAAWIIIQHSISKPSFMKKALEMLLNTNNLPLNDRVKLAYLSDRIAVFEGKKQFFGTQFDWDENGEMSPQAYDDINEVNRRRKELGLNSLKEQIDVMRQRVSKENQKAPKNPEQKKIEFEKWRRSVGWIK